MRPPRARGPAARRRRGSSRRGSACHRASRAAAVSAAARRGAQRDRLARDVDLGRVRRPGDAPRPRGGSGRACRSPCARRRRRVVAQRLLDPAQRSRRTRASPSRRAGAGCRCCCSPTPGRPPAAGLPSAPVLSIVWPDSASRCSIQVSGSASAALWPCSRRANSATNALVSGGAERAMSATTQDQVARRRSRPPRACCRPRCRPCRDRCSRRRRATRPGAGSRSAPGAA